MADQQPTYDDRRAERRAELDRLEREIVGLDEDIQGVRDSLTDSGPLDPEDRSAVLRQAEELQTIRNRLRLRRDKLLEELGAEG